jgi:hypothetical protein
MKETESMKTAVRARAAGLLLALALAVGAQGSAVFYHQPGLLALAPGWTVTVDVGLGTYGNSPGAFALRVDFDTNVLQVVRITNDASSVFRDSLFVAPLEETTGTVRIVAFQTGTDLTSPADETPCHITWQAVARSCVTSDVRLHVETFIDSAWRAVEVEGWGFSVVVDGTDTDADNLPDFWEMAYFGSPTGAVWDADDDGDHSKNGEEYLAGTDPTNALSSLAITNVNATAGGQALVFPTSRFRSYRLQAAGALGTEAAWSNRTDSLFGTGGPLTVQAPTPAGQCFYRIQVNPP